MTAKPRSAKWHKQQAEKLAQLEHHIEQIRMRLSQLAAEQENLLGIPALESELQNRTNELRAAQTTGTEREVFFAEQALDVLTTAQINARRDLTSCPSIVQARIQLNVTLHESESLRYSISGAAKHPALRNRRNERVTVKAVLESRQLQHADWPIYRLISAVDPITGEHMAKRLWVWCQSIDRRADVELGDAIKFEGTVRIWSSELSMLDPQDIQILQRPL